MKNLIFILALVFSSFASAQGIGGKAGIGGEAGIGGGAVIPSITILGAGQGEQHSASATTSVVTGVGSSSSAFSCAAGNSEIAFFGTSSSVSGTASDSASNSGWTSYGAIANDLQLFYNFNIASPTTSVTVTYASTAMGSYVGAICVSGLTGHKDFTQVAYATGIKGTAWVSGTFTTTQANELVCSSVANSDSTSLSATFPAILQLNFANNTSPYFYPSMGVVCTIYNSTQSGVTQAGTFGISTDGDSLTGGWY